MMKLQDGAMEPLSIRISVLVRPTRATNGHSS